MALHTTITWWRLLLIFKQFILTKEHMISIH